MRIRWTTRIVMAMGVLTLIAGVAAGGGGTARAATFRSVSASASAGPRSASYVTGGELTLILHWNGRTWS